MHKSIIILVALAVLALSANENRPYNFSHALTQDESAWVDSIFNALTPDERLGQLFVLRAHSDKDAAYEQNVAALIQQYKPGGLCFFQGTPEHQAELTNWYQSMSDRLPLMISMDAEWGLGMRLKESTISYPKQLMLGAMRDNRLIYDMGREVARQCLRLGVHLNFAPDADINNNPQNPVINDRSFGEDRYKVAAKCFQYMMGLQDGGVLACAKHFPGHGDTNVDSHFDLPLIPHNLSRLDSLELFPFRVLSQYGIASAMVSHLQVPALDDRANRPVSLSENTVYQLLRKKIGFDGLIYTDGMEMKAVAKYFKPGEADLEALKAGNDVILLPADMGAALNAIKQALATGYLMQSRIDESVRRVLRAKFRLGLTKPQRVELANIRRDLNAPAGLLLKRRLIEQSLTLVRDRQALVPFPDLEKYRFATLGLGSDSLTVFQKTCGQMAPVLQLNAPKTLTPEQMTALFDTLANTDVVLLSLHDMRSKAADNFGLTDSEVNFIRSLNTVKKVVLTVFGNPYSLKYFDFAPTVLLAYNGDEQTQDLTAQALFGANNLSGRLPVTVSPVSKFGDGVDIAFDFHRLGYDLPEAVGMSSDTLALMDDIIQEMIGSGATPGCQVLVAKDGKVVWQKSYGHYTYEHLQPVTNESIFDLASVTKTAATTISLMRLYDAGKFDLAKEMSRYVPELKGTDKQTLKTDEILAHCAGLTPWIAFYKNTLENGLPDQHLYHSTPDQDSETPVAAGMFLVNHYADTLWNTIAQSALRPNKNYKYSDLDLILGGKAVENISGKKLDRFADENFYRPLGLATMTFNPWQKGLTLRCLPTEEDRYFRQQRIQGYVHDMAAAMFGGVSGHAGLFSNANDLAKIYQMLLNQGAYFGKQYLSQAAVHTWTTRYARSTRRGMGFDMKELDPRETKNMSDLAGPNTFGHTGFTGICVWADPDKNLIFVFCSNRTYPSMENNKLISGDYRPRLQSLVYRAMVPSI